MNLNSNFYLIEKPKSWTSQDLCTKFKKTYKFKKVGHSGTLDPNAEGLMLVATNSFTKLFDYIGNTNKTYYVKALLGFTSDTLDVDSDYKKVDDINKADVILLGVSRTSKTPTSIYLANKGFRTSNIPLVNENSIPDILKKKPHSSFKIKDILKKEYQYFRITSIGCAFLGIC